MDETSIYSCDDHLDLRSVPPELWQSRLPKDLVERGPRVVTATAIPCGSATTACWAAAACPRGDKLQVLSAVSRAGLEDDGFRVSDPKLRLEDMDLDGVWASVIYGPIPLTLSIPEPDLQTACYAAWNDWAIEEFNAFAPDRLCALAVPAQPLARGGGGRARAGGRAGPPGGDHRRVRLRRRRSGLGPPVGRRRADRPAPQLPHQGRGVAATELPGGQVAVGGVRHPPAPAAGRGAGHHGLLRGPRAAPRAHAGAGRGRRRLAAVLPEPGWTWSGRTSGTRSTTRPSIAPSELFKRQVIATFEEEAWPTSSSRTSGPTPACGRRTTPTPTARSPSRSAPSRRRWACCPARTVARSRRLNCARLYGFEYVA